MFWFVKKAELFVRSCNQSHICWFCVEYKLTFFYSRNWNVL